MEKNIVAKISVNINAPASKVWKCITDVDMIKEYLFGTKVHTDWKVGSPITYSGEWSGKSYQDKGIILQIIPEKIFESTYWSSMSDLEDKPENYNKVTYELEDNNGITTLSLTQDNNKDEESKKHSEENWTLVLDAIKKMVER